MSKEKCPTCGTMCQIEWHGLDLVAESGDETLASKTYTPNMPTDKEIEHAAPACPEMDRMDIQARNWFIAGAKWCRMTMSIPVTDNP